MFYRLAQFYIHVYHFIHASFGIRLRGMGFVQRLISSDHVLSFKGKKIFFYHRIRGSYDCLLIGRSNEPESHLFLDTIFKGCDESFSFIDVGASVGEMVIGVSNHPNVGAIYAFEPRAECCQAITKSNELNGESRIRVIQKAVGESIGSVTFYYLPSGSGSGLHKNEDQNGTGMVVPLTTLDAELPAIMPNPVLLVDVEGFEPGVLKGGLNFIKKNNPLIIFEYNATSKRFFNLSDISSILGPSYDIYRVTEKGTLDKDFDRSWNCAAVPRNSFFERRVKG